MWNTCRLPSLFSIRGAACVGKGHAGDGIRTSCSLSSTSADEASFNRAAQAVTNHIESASLPRADKDNESICLEEPHNMLQEEIEEDLLSMDGFPDHVPRHSECVEDGRLGFCDSLAADRGMNSNCATAMPRELIDLIKSTSEHQDDESISVEDDDSMSEKDEEGFEEGLNGLVRWPDQIPQRLPPPCVVQRNGQDLAASVALLHCRSGVRHRALSASSTMMQMQVLPEVPECTSECSTTVEDLDTQSLASTGSGSSDMKNVGCGSGVPSAVQERYRVSL